jgi:peptide-methionine (S)-S-oxide reductase
VLIFYYLGELLEMKIRRKIFIILFITIAVFGCKENKSQNQTIEKVKMEDKSTLDTATFGTGCFWCTDAIFKRLKGVDTVISGFSGGTVSNPTYEQVCTGNTGHAEVCQIIFNPKEISYDELLQVFWKIHDPTTLNRQGNDVGTQYRSVIFYHNEDQKKKAEYYKEELNKSGAWKNPVVTEISPFTAFYSAENYHQDYFAKNPHAGYCSYIIAPKVEKFEKVFKDKLKKD